MATSAQPGNPLFAAGEAVATLRLATSEHWKDKSSGESRESTEWHRIVLFRALAEIAERYLKKGAQVYIEGRLRTRKWQDKNGQDRYTSEIEATEFRMLGGAEKSGLQDRQSLQASEEKATGNFARKTSEMSDPWDVPGGSQTVDLDKDPLPF